MGGRKKRMVSGQGKRNKVEKQNRKKRGREGERK